MPETGSLVHQNLFLLAGTQILSNLIEILKSSIKLPHTSCYQRGETMNSQVLCFNELISILYLSSAYPEVNLYFCEYGHLPSLRYAQRDLTRLLLCSLFVKTTDEQYRNKNIIKLYLH
jgi:hypothetical protein